MRVTPMLSGLCICQGVGAQRQVECEMTSLGTTKARQPEDRKRAIPHLSPSETHTAPGAQWPSLFLRLGVISLCEDFVRRPRTNSDGRDYLAWPGALVQSLVPAIPALRGWNQEDQKSKLVLRDIHKFAASLSYKNPVPENRTPGSSRSASVAHLCQEPLNLRGCLWPLLLLPQLPPAPFVSSLTCHLQPQGQAHASSQLLVTFIYSRLGSSDPVPQTPSG